LCKSVHSLYPVESISRNCRQANAICVGNVNDVCNYCLK